MRIPSLLHRIASALVPIHYWPKDKKSVDVLHFGLLDDDKWQYLRKKPLRVGLPANAEHVHLLGAFNEAAAAVAFLDADSADYLMAAEKFGDEFKATKADCAGLCNCGVELTGVIASGAYKDASLPIEESGYVLPGHHRVEALSQFGCLHLGHWAGRPEIRFSHS